MSNDRPYVRVAFALLNKDGSVHAYTSIYHFRAQPLAEGHPAQCSYDRYHRDSVSSPALNCTCGYYATRDPELARYYLEYVKDIDDFFYDYHEPICDRRRALLQVHPHGLVLHGANGTVRSEYQQVLGELDPRDYFSKVRAEDVGYIDPGPITPNPMTKLRN